MARNGIRVIHQFLLDNNFVSTAKTLIEEASKMGFQMLEHQSEVTDLYAQLMLCFNTGNYFTFFQLWNDFFTDNVKQCKEYKKLTFYLHVYFAILPKCKLHTCGYKQNLILEKSNKDVANNKQNNATGIEKNINDSMKQLQDYLNGNGKELEHDVELQPFYALPFIENLHADTFFSKILEQYWFDELSRNLDLFIINHKQVLRNLQDLLDMNKIDYDKAQLQSPLQVGTNALSMKMKTASESLDLAENKGIKSNTPIVPNDRNIPIFLDDTNEHEERYNFCHIIDRGLNLRSAQTRINGDRIIVDNLREDKLNEEENIESLFEIYKRDKRLVQCNRELALTKTRLYSIHANYEELKLKFHKLHTDYHKLIDVAGELTVALENSVKGQTVDIQQTLEICMKIFPDLFNQNIGETSYPSLLQLGYTDIKTSALPEVDVTAISVPPNLLDFKKIRLHLLNGDVKTKLLLLQALRWKITLVQSTQRDEALHEYIRRDLLGLDGQISNENGRSVVPFLLTAGEAYARHLLQQFTARLLNAIASFKCGRDYLSVGSTIVNATFACLDNNYVDGVDVFACDMMIAMLQKLSLRRQQRIYMIESGLLEWLIDHLRNKCRVVSLYRLEYATALLMNLSLHRLARARASKMSSLLVSTLLILLSTDHSSLLPYINGALSNFLSDPVINEEARKMKRSNISDYLIDCDQKAIDVRKHLDQILRMQETENLSTPQNEETADDDNKESDLLEKELDENDPLKNYVGELNGETLLAMCYSVSSKIPRNSVITDTALQKISVLNPFDFYNNQQNDHLYTKHLSYPTLRIESNVLPEKSDTEIISTKGVSDLSSTFSKQRQIATNSADKVLLSTNERQSNAEDPVGTESSLVAKCKNQIYEKRDENVASLKNIICWLSSAIEERRHKRYQFDRDNRIGAHQDSELKMENTARKDVSRSHSSESKIGVENLRDEKFERTNLEELSSNEAKYFTICLYKNQKISKNSSETAMTSSTTFASNRKNGLTEMEKFGGIASLNNYDSDIANGTFWKNDPGFVKEEEAFLAKPKISRTPP